MSYSYQDGGTFPSEAAAIDWARRNNIDPRDLHIRTVRDGVEVGVRRSKSRSTYDDRYGGRNRGFF